METLTGEQFKQRYSGEIKVGQTIPKAQFDQTYDEVKPKTDLLDKMAGIFSTVFGGKEVGEWLGTQIAKAQNPEQAQFLSQPTGLQIAGDVASIGLSLAGLKGAGLAGSIGRRVLTNAGLGAGISAAKSVAEGSTNLKEIGQSATGGAIVGGTIPIAGATFRAIGRQIEGLPTRLINSALGRTKQQIMKDIATDKVDDFAKFVTQNKPIGTAKKLLSDSIDSIDSLDKKITDALASGVTKTGGKTSIGVNNFLDELTTTPEAQGALYKRADVRNIIERLAPQTKQLIQKGSLTLSEANKLRQLADKTLGDRAFLGGQLSSDKAILKSFADGLRELVKSKAPDGTRTLFAEFSNEIRFRDTVLSKIASGDKNRLLSLSGILGGAVGSILGGGVPGALGGIAAVKAIESVPVKIAAAKVASALTKAAPVLMGLTPLQQTAILNVFGEIFSSTGNRHESIQ